MHYSDEFRRKFHPDHLADLAKSGLTEETITALAIYTARPQDIPKLVGFDPQGVESALVFPYAGVEGFCRLKPFPPWRDKEGKEHKYLQRPASGVPLYITPSAQAILKDPTKPLTFTEGEKKAAALHQAGVPAVGLGGLDNWMQRGEPIHDLDEIAWAERPISQDDDSDIWSRPDLLRRVYAFGRELEERGAKVTVRQIPPVNDARAGADDFLVARGAEAYRALPCLPLTHKAFGKAKAWHAEWVKKRPTPPPDADALRAQLVERPRLRFAQDVYEGHLFYGIGAGDQAHILTAGRALIPLAQVAAQAEIKAPSRARNPLSLEAIRAFRDGAQEPTPALLRALADYYARHLIWPFAEAPVLLACWTLGTYAYQLFHLFPYFGFLSPAKQCGKTRALTLVSAVGFAARPVTTSPTEAVIFRGAEAYGGVACFDEVESLIAPNSQRAQECRSVLNHGFQKGGEVERASKQPDGSIALETFHVYQPRAFACVGDLPETLEDRCITITLQRRKQNEPIARLRLRDLPTITAPLRDRCAVWALEHADALAEAYAKPEDPEELRGLDDRARDLWEIPWLIADAARQEGDPGFLQQLATAAQQAATERQATEADTRLVALIEALIETCAGSILIITPKDLLQKVQQRMGEEAPRTPRRLAAYLKRLGIRSGKEWLDQKSQRAYTLNPDILESLRERYAPEGK
ncbi:MAG: DUF3631 domain-containing protein [Candidatus Methylomirabilota bacterium]